jgi:hypothetical protein
MENELYKTVIRYISDGELEGIEDAIDEYNYEILGKYADCVTEMLGMGGLGFALLCKDNKNVVKLTLDKTEYNFAMNAHKFPNYQSLFVKIHDVDKLAEIDGQILSLIHKEYAFALNKSEVRLFDVFRELNHICNEMHDRLDYYFGVIARKQYSGLDIMDYYEITELEKQKINYRRIFEMMNDDNYPTNEVDRIVYDCMRNYINWFSGINLNKVRNPKVLRFADKVYSLSKNDGIFFYDFKSGNIGKRNDNDGDYCIFDFGHVFF